MPSISLLKKNEVEFCFVKRKLMCERIKLQFLQSKILWLFERQLLKASRQGAQTLIFLGISQLINITITIKSDERLFGSPNRGVANADLFSSLFQKIEIQLIKNTASYKTPVEYLYKETMLRILFYRIIKENESIDFFVIKRK